MRACIFHVPEDRSKTKLSLTDRNNDDLAVLDREILQMDHCDSVPKQLKCFGNDRFLLLVIIGRHQVRAVQNDLQIIGGNQIQQPPRQLRRVQGMILACLNAYRYAETFRFRHHGLDRNDYLLEGFLRKVIRCIALAYASCFRTYQAGSEITCQAKMGAEII